MTTVTDLRDELMESAVDAAQRARLAEDEGPESFESLVRANYAKAALALTQAICTIDSARRGHR